MGVDQTDEWEQELTRRSGPKFKSPIKVIEPLLSEVDLDFCDPVIDEPPVKKEAAINVKLNVVELPKKRSDKNDKSKLF